MASIFERIWGTQERVRTAIESTPSLVSKGGRRGVLSPWTPNTLETFPWYDLFDVDATGVSRTEAMTIPAVHKARSVILSLAADAPLTAYRREERVTPQPAWLSRTRGILGPWQRTAWTIDDLAFYGWSLWACIRDAEGFILDAERVPQEDWMFDSEGRVNVLDPDGQYVIADESEVILIPGPGAGLLDTFGRTLRGAVALERAWVARAMNPIPMVDLHETQEQSLEPGEAQEVVDDWAKARQDPNGAIAFTPATIEARALGQLSPDMFTEGRNFLRLDVAAFFALPASILDGSVATASLTYSTTALARNEVLDYSIPYWVRPIEDRLSQDDVVPRGQSVKFDFTAKLTLPQPPINPTED